MRKTTKLIVISITGLILMACGLGGYTQQKVESQPILDSVPVETQTPVESLPGENITTANEPLLSEEVKSAIMIEDALTPTIDSLSSAKSCLTKTWEINGLSDYVIAAVPAELAEEYSLEYVDTTGQAFLTLAPGQKIVLDAENLVFLFNARFAIFEVPVTVSINGKATGTYEIDSTMLQVHNMDTSKLTASAMALNEDLMEPAQIIDSIPFVRPPFNTAKYNCQGEILELELSGYPSNLPPLLFKAVN